MVGRPGVHVLVNAAEDILPSGQSEVRAGGYRRSMSGAAPHQHIPHAQAPQHVFVEYVRVKRQIS
jgi:hypothetical protein